MGRDIHYPRALIFGLAGKPAPDDEPQGEMDAVIREGEQGAPRPLTDTKDVTSKEKNEQHLFTLPPKY
jgi:hypothetical protein